ncbi:MAG: hypothetical protein HYZ94_00620, partial [Candidatus Omnitrophica bacterium]|nr:hypothetical protein [Candidatus Omnitrophota bacterium]
APGSNSNDLYGRSLRVGTAYQNTPPPADGRALIFDRLGIGTAQPDRPLHIRASGVGADGTSMARIIIQNGLGNAFYLNTFDGVNRFSIGRIQPATQDIGIDGTTGGVGIGTAQVPHVTGGWGGSLQRSRLWLTDLDGADQDVPALVIAGPDGGAVQFVDGSRSAIGDLGAAPTEIGMASRSSLRSLTFYTTPPSGPTTRRMTILPNGNVGIGTSTPGMPLHVIGSASFRHPGSANNRIDLTAADPNIGMELRGTGPTGSGGTPYLDFSNDAGSDFDARVILLDNDNLRIEGARLHLESEAYPSPVPVMPPTAPNGRMLGNLNTNDVWLRSARGNAGGWVSDLLTAGGGYEGTKVRDVGSAAGFGGPPFRISTALLAGATRLRIQFTAMPGGTSEYAVWFYEGPSVLISLSELAPVADVMFVKLFEIPRRATRAEIRFNRCNSMIIEAYR